MESFWWHVFDILGTAAFAYSGALVAVSRRMDLFGVFALSSATAVGGGIVRDTMLGNFPPAAFRTSLYVIIIVLAMVLAIITIRNVQVKRKFSRIMPAFFWLYTIFDAIGLGSFSVTGTLLGCHYYPEYSLFAVLLGVLTAVGGGIIRDIFAAKIPFVFRREIYATASLVGSTVLTGCFYTHWLSLAGGAILSFILTVLIRLLAVTFHWNLPLIRRKHRRSFL
ncbi:trimeric intracellular cation channel family protein [uncultured Megasphaera sp.]|uniref:trimeric intracellular cation channel family protein n=1 Tax=uncultured Megasphaera sp. TaxID=165188 RepID=UPI0025936ABA|nr:trimeric intracellular cation channel family protein [uncultured Megasphaera sp.]